MVGLKKKKKKKKKNNNNNNNNNLLNCWKKSDSRYQARHFLVLNFCVNAVRYRTIEMILRTDGRTNRGSDIVLNWLWASEHKKK